MSFLDYKGSYIISNNGKYNFFFNNKKNIITDQYFIVSPTYDVGFKKIFFYNYESKDIVHECLNSILYPISKSIKSLDSLPKEILSNSHIKHNKGTRIVDNAYLAKIEYDVEGQKYLKKVILAIEMQKSKLSDSFTERFFDYATGMRNSHDFKETWVIALCLDDSYQPGYNKGSNSYVTKELNIDKTQHRKNYVDIYEIYLNKLYNELEPKSPINGEKIDIIGKEWIKLFCLPLWCKSNQDDYINYIIPYRIKFYGEQIQNAIKILGTFQDYERAMIKRQLMDNQKKEKEKYDEGFDKGKNEGFAEGAKIGFAEGEKKGFAEGEKKGFTEGEEKGFAEGAEKGFAEGAEKGFAEGAEKGFAEGAEKGFAEGAEKGFAEGAENCLANILREFYINYKRTNSAANIQILGKIKYSFLEKKFWNNTDLFGIAQMLQDNDLLIKDNIQ